MNFFFEMWKSFGHAWRGLLVTFRTERSFRIQVAAAFVVFLVLILLPLQGWERAFLLLATASVLVLELLNSMVERLVDLVKPRVHGYVRDIKDIMAAAVLVVSLFALAIGILILWPYAGRFFSQV
jgi:diacylglycerol kinase